MGELSEAGKNASWSHPLRVGSTDPVPVASDGLGNSAITANDRVGVPVARRPIGEGSERREEDDSRGLLLTALYSARCVLRGSVVGRACLSAYAVADREVCRTPTGGHSTHTSLPTARKRLRAGGTNPPCDRALGVHPGTAADLTAGRSAGIMYSGTKCERLMCGPNLQNPKSPAIVCRRRYPMRVGGTGTRGPHGQSGHSIKNNRISGIRTRSSTDPV
jgi:hypothetical protein